MFIQNIFLKILVVISYNFVLVVCYANLWKKIWSKNIIQSNEMKCLPSDMEFDGNGII